MGARGSHLHMGLPMHVLACGPLQFCYNTKTGEVLRGEVFSFGAELNNPDTW